MHQSVNDSYIWFRVAADSLELASESSQVVAAREFQVPSRRAGKTVKRNEGQVQEILERARRTGLGRAVFVQLVAEMEAFLSDVLEATLIHDHSRLKVSVQGIDHTKSIKRDEVVDRIARGDLVEHLIQKELAAVFYANPRAQLDYLEQVTGITIDQSLVSSWSEIKATRDLLAHNSGRINSTYMRKAGELARGDLGSLVDVDDEYVTNSMATLKSMVGKIASAIQRDPLPAV